MLSETEERNLSVIREYFAATNRGDLDAMTALTTPDIVFENTSPAPDGEQLVGQTLFRSFFETLFRNNRATQEVPERIIPGGDFCTVQWRYDWTDARGVAGHIRGVSIFRLDDGKIAEHLNYVKG